MSRRRTPLFVFALGALALGACECIKTVPQCPGGVKCITYDQYCDQANPSLWAMGQVCGVVAKDVPYPAAYPQRDIRCTEELRTLIDAGTVAFNSVAAQLCVTTRATTCDPICRWDLPLAGPWGTRAPLTRCSEPCDRIFTGTKETGESCALSAECLEGLWCDATKSCPGRCARQISEGETAPSLEACRTPMGNPLSDGGFRCESLVDAGARCEKDDDEGNARHCLPGYACAHAQPSAADGGGDAGEPDASFDAGADGGIVDAGPEPFFCEPWPDGGVLAGDCLSVGCPYGELCWGDSSDGFRCAAFGDAGTLCSIGSVQPVAPCLGGIDCVQDGGFFVCGHAAVGTPCTFGSDCAPADACGADAGCSPRGALGEPCDAVACQQDLDCARAGDAGFICSPLSTLGQPCADVGNHFCAYGFTCFDGGCLANACLPSP